MRRSGYQSTILQSETRGERGHARGGVGCGVAESSLACLGQSASQLPVFCSGKREGGRAGSYQSSPIGRLQPEHSLPIGRPAADFKNPGRAVKSPSLFQIVLRLGQLRQISNQPKRHHERNRSPAGWPVWQPDWSQGKTGVKLFTLQPVQLTPDHPSCHLSWADLVVKLSVVS